MYQEKKEVILVTAEQERRAINYCDTFDGNYPLASG